MSRCPSPPTGRQPCHWLKAHPYSVCAVLVLVVLSILFYLRTDTEWEKVFVRAAAALWVGGDMYARDGAYLYPPFMAWAILPFAALPPALGRGVWLLVNLVCLVAMVSWGWRAAGGRSLEGGSPVWGKEHTAALLGLLCGASYLQNCWAHLQTDIVIGALLLGGCLLLMGPRPYGAATCFGLAAACKCTPLLWLPYLLWRRQPGAAAWLLCVAVGVNLLPDLVSAPPSGRLWLAEYAVRYLEPLTRADHYAGSWGSEIVYNQSLAGAGQRWLATSLEWGGKDCTAVPRADPVGPLVLRCAVYGASLLVVFGCLWACGGPLRPIAADGGPVSRQALEAGVLLLLMLLLSPMSSKAHFGVLILPGFCLARATLRGRDPCRWGLLLGAVALALLGNKGLLGNRLYTVSLWAGTTTWGTLFLLAGCCLVLRQQRAGRAGGLPCPATPPTLGRAA